MSWPSRSQLQGTLTAIGGVAALAGASGVLRGAAEVVGGGPVSARVDSEYRFYAAWYAVFGVLALRAARDPERHSVLVQATSAGFATAALGRALSWRRLGPPNTLQKALLAIELAIPTVIIPWQAAAGQDDSR